MTFERALITGATSGIGEALAKLLAKKKISLLLSGRNYEKLEALCTELASQVEVIPLAADLADRNERQKVISLIDEYIPDLIINNAGFGIYGECLSSLEQQLAILEVNGTALLECTLKGAKAMKNASKKGVILNVSSIAGKMPMPGMAVYAASKAFVTSFSQAIDVELEASGIRVLVFCPGQVATDFANRAAKKQLKKRQGPIIGVNDAASAIIQQIETRKEHVVFDWRYRVLTSMSKCIPQQLLKNMLWKRIQRRL